MTQAPHDPEEEAFLREARRLWRASWPAGVPAEPTYAAGEIALSSYLTHWAAVVPDKTAIGFYGRDITYRELDRLSDAFARYLEDQGVRAGDRVAAYLPTCPQFHVVFFGVLKRGAVMVPVNPMLREHELEFVLQDSGARLIVAQDSLVDLALTVMPRIGLETVVVTCIADMLPADDADIPVPAGLRSRHPVPDALPDLMDVIANYQEQAPLAPADPDRIAILNYTGGTTGMPKGCVHTQRDMIYTAATVCTCAYRIGHDDVLVSYAPIFWIGGECSGLVFPVFLGATVALLTRWDAEAYMAAIQRYRVTDVGLVVDNLQAVLNHPRRSSYDLSSLKRSRATSFIRKLDIETRRAWQEATGTIVTESGWGATETHTFDAFSAGFQEDDFDLKARPVLAGLPMPGTEFKICDFQTGAVLPLGTEGEIAARSPSLLKGYWNKPDETARALRNGWFHSGDIGYLDEKGLLHYLGRQKEMLKVKGMSVFPAEIEMLLGKNPAVGMVSVVGRPDPDKGEVPVAFVRPAEGVDRGGLPESLADWSRRNMASYKVPEIRVLDEFPLTATGKVIKDELKLLI